MGHLFQPWVDECPLIYASNNAPKKVNILGTFLLSILSGHTRYAHMTSLMADHHGGQIQIKHHSLSYATRLVGPLFWALAFCQLIF